MRWWRVSRVQRSLAILVIASLCSVLFAATEQPAERTSSYADWVRTQLRVPADAAFEEALGAADERARTFEGFLRAFVEAYEAQQPEGSLARAFLTDDLSTDALITYLQSRFSRVVGDAVLPRIVMATASASASSASDRQGASLALLPEREDTKVLAGISLRRAARMLIVVPLRTLWDAQPLGP